MQMNSCQLNQGTYSRITVRPMMSGPMQTPARRTFAAGGMNKAKGAMERSEGRFN